MNEEDELSRVYASPREGGPSGVRSKKITISTIKTDGHPPPTGYQPRKRMRATQPLEPTWEPEPEMLRINQERKTHHYTLTMKIRISRPSVTAPRPCVADSTARCGRCSTAQLAPSRALQGPADLQQISKRKRSKQKTGRTCGPRS